MKPITPKLRQLVDWRAAAWAGLISGCVFFLLNLFVTPLVLGGNPWVMVRLMASILLGEGILAPPATFHLWAFIVAILSNTILCLAFGLLAAYVLHRGGIVMGFAGGAALGLAIYGINFYTLTWFYPWFFAFRGWVMIVNHVILGTLAGGIYEWLEVERFVTVADEKS
jgi:hypothetical protein